MSLAEARRKIGLRSIVINGRRRIGHTYIYWMEMAPTFQYVKLDTNTNTRASACARRCAMSPIMMKHRREREGGTAELDGQEEHTHTFLTTVVMHVVMRSHFPCSSNFQQFCVAFIDLESDESSRSAGVSR